MSWRCLKTLEYAICLKSNVHVLQIVINDVSLNLTFKKYIYHQLVPALDDGPAFFVVVEKKQLSVHRLIVDIGAKNVCSMMMSGTRKPW